MCSVLEVSRSGYYAWRKRPLSNRCLQNEILLKRISEIYNNNKKVYGSPRIFSMLRYEGFNCGLNRVAKLMRYNGIQARQYRKAKRKVKYTSVAKVDNLLDRKFNVPVPNKVWASDITCFWTGRGWLNLAIVMDLYSRKIIGWSMKSKMTEDLTIEALNMALLKRKASKGLMHHSDQGTQYQSKAYRNLLRKKKITQSMSRKGECYDNAVVESFFKTLKAEIDDDNRFATKEEAQAKIFEYIEIFYNSKRLHSSLGYQSPKQFEEQNVIH